MLFLGHKLCILVQPLWESRNSLVNSNKENIVGAWLNHYTCNKYLDRYVSFMAKKYILTHSNWLLVKWLKWENDINQSGQNCWEIGLTAAHAVNTYWTWAFWPFLVMLPTNAFQHCNCQQGIPHWVLIGRNYGNDWIKILLCLCKLNFHSIRYSTESLNKPLDCMTCIYSLVFLIPVRIWLSSKSEN